MNAAKEFSIFSDSERTDGQFWKNVQKEQQIQSQITTLLPICTTGFTMMSIKNIVQSPSASGILLSSRVGKIVKVVDNKVTLTIFLERKKPSLIWPETHLKTPTGLAYNSTIWPQPLLSWTSTSMTSTIAFKWQSQCQSCPARASIWLAITRNASAKKSKSDTEFHIFFYFSSF